MTQPSERNHPPLEFVRPSVRTLAAYTPGEQPQDRRYIKLNTNENPYPPSPRVIEAVRAAATEDLRLYPDPLANALRDRAAARLRPARASTSSSATAPTSCWPSSCAPASVPATASSTRTRPTASTIRWSPSRKARPSTSPTRRDFSLPAGVGRGGRAGHLRLSTPTRRPGRSCRSTPSTRWRSA